jgi:hypothetical protein
MNPPPAETSPIKEGLGGLGTPFFHGLAAFKLKANRFYRIYVMPDELIFVYAGSGGEVASALSLLAPFLESQPLVPVVRALASALDPRSEIAARLREFDVTPIQI